MIHLKTELLKNLSNELKMEISLKGELIIKTNQFNNYNFVDKSIWENLISEIYLENKDFTGTLLRIQMFENHKSNFLN